MAVKSVAIIGAGPSGVITLDSLVREQAFDKIKLFERRHEAGGCWIYNEKNPEPLGDISKLSERNADTPIKIPENLPAFVAKSSNYGFRDTATYSYLETNVVASSMEFSEEPIPAGGTESSIEKYGKNTPFRHNLKIKEWIQGLYKKKGYDDYLSFNTSVEMVKKNESSKKWDVTLRRFEKQSDYIWTENFDAVVIASGHYDVPYVPFVPGLQEFSENSETTVIHSKLYRSRDPFKDKKVIVVGASISAMEAVQDILPVVQSNLILSQKKSSKPHVYFGTAAFDHPLVEKHGEIIKIDNSTRTVYFDDDTSISNVDCIIYATGFTFSYPFLQNLNLSGNRVNGLYQHIFSIEDETLTFVGAIVPGLTFKLFEWQAVAIARIFAGRSKLPTTEEQKAWERKRLKTRGDGSNFITIYPYFEEYFEDLRNLAGDDGPGRKLPHFEKAWIDNFFSGHRIRINYWLTKNGSRMQKRID